MQAVPVGELQERLTGAGAILEDPGDIANSFYESIAWAYHEGITDGCGDVGMFCPNDELPRNEMASLLARALDLPPATVDHFDDDDGQSHEADINRVAEAGITFGCAELMYCPGQIVTREQMAGFLARAFALAPTRSTFSWMTRRRHSRRASTDWLHPASPRGWDGHFCPKATVTRGQTMAFLFRHFDGGPSGGGLSSTGSGSESPDRPEPMAPPRPPRARRPSQRWSRHRRRPRHRFQLRSRRRQRRRRRPPSRHRACRERPRARLRDGSRRDRQRATLTGGLEIAVYTPTLVTTGP